MWTRWSTVSASVALFLALGCGGGVERPKMGKVSGKVVVKGQPLTKRLVTFVPGVGAATDAATATTNSDGTYRLTTFDDGDGAIVGDHNVTVMSKEDDPLAKGEGMPTPDQIAKAKKPKSLIPEKYAELGKSGLRFSVKEGSNTIDIPLD